MDRLGVFAKYWQPGRVKSRLGQSIGMEAASLIYQGFLACVLQRWSETGQVRDVVIWPPARQVEFDDLVAHCGAVDGRPSWNCVAQSDGDLGQRLRHYTQAAFSSGTRRLLVLGTDSPDLPRSYLDTAWQRLTDHDVVLGPAEDGGYYLIGLGADHPELFQGVPWSSQQTLAATLSAAAGDDLKVHLLPKWYDVDDLESLARLIGNLADRTDVDPSSRDSIDATTLASLLEILQPWHRVANP